MSDSYFEYVKPILDGHPLEYRLGLKFVNDRIDVRSNSEKLIEILRDYYRDFLGEGGEPVFTINALETAPVAFDLDYIVKQPEPGKTSLKEEYKDFPDGRVVHKLKTDMVFLFGESGRFAVGPCIVNDAQVVNFVNNSFIELVIKRGALLFHAAGVAINGKGLSMVGFSGAGKSTLALEIMRHDTDFVSNDRVMVQRDGGKLVMTGVAKMPRVNPGTVIHNQSLWAVMSEEERLGFEKLPQAELWDLEHKYDAFIDQCYGPGKFTLQSEMRGLVILNWKRDDSPLHHSLVNLHERRDLMPAFMKSVGLFFEMDDPAADLDFSEEHYLELLGDCPVLEFTGGVDFQGAAAICLDFLREQSA